MIRRTVKIQLVAFALISLLGIFYVGTNYVGFHFLRSGPYTVTLVLPQTGGIFTNAEVTERGVTVGRVGGVHLASGTTCGDQPHCVRVDLEIENDRQIPQDLHATVANLSAVGEQYVDLEPQAAGGPYLKDGSVITADHATLPIPDAKLLVDLDKLLTSVNRRHLATMIDELGKGFDNLGPALQSLIDNGNALTAAAIRNLPQQLRLIDDGKTVLDTQNAVSAELKAWAASWASFSDQLRVSDPALRGILDNGVGASQELAGLLRDNAPALPTLLGNLITVNQIQAVRLPYVRATLELFPAQVAGGFYVTPGDGTAHFGNITNNYSPCTTGYSSTKLRGNSPSEWGGPGNLDAYCHGKGITSDYRGSRLVPRPRGDHAQVTNSDPYAGPRYGHSKHPTVREQRAYSWGNRTGSGGGSGGGGGSSGSGTAVAPYDPTTGLFTAPGGQSYQLGYDGPFAQLFGSSSWKWLLLAPTMR